MAPLVHVRNFVVFVLQFSSVFTQILSSLDKYTYLTFYCVIMGGGDLNLKKSWHPSTLRNIERVWKAEQQHSAEQKKIEQLQKELENERGREDLRQYAENKGVVGKKSDRLDWMYAGPAAMVNREEYLVGRTVDKTFEVMDLHDQGLMDDNANEASLPGASFSGSSVNVSIDLANKIREDPLFAIKKKEQQAKKELFMNPVKMKQLQKYLEKSVKKSGTKKKSKKKKSKKQKHEESSSSSDRSDEGRFETKNRKSRKSFEDDRNVKSTNGIKRRRIHCSDDEEDLNDRKSIRHSRHKEYHGDRRKSRGGEVNVGKKSDKRKINDELTSYKDSYRRSSDDEGRPVKKFGLIGGNKKIDNTGKVDYRLIKKEKPSVYKPAPRRKLDAEEIERKRSEMLENAKWRDEQRSRNVERYREEAAREVDKHSKSGGAKFITPLLSEVAEYGSVEARIKRNKFKVQRTVSDLDKNFTKR